MCVFRLPPSLARSLSPMLGSGPCLEPGSNKEEKGLGKDCHGCGMTGIEGCAKNSIMSQRILFRLFQPLDFDLGSSSIREGRDNHRRRAVFLDTTTLPLDLGWPKKSDQTRQRWRPPSQFHRFCGEPTHPSPPHRTSNHGASRQTRPHPFGLRCKVPSTETRRMQSGPFQELSTIPRPLAPSILLPLAAYGHPLRPLPKVIWLTLSPYESEGPPARGCE